MRILGSCVKSAWLQQLSMNKTFLLSNEATILSTVLLKCSVTHASTITVRGLNCWFCAITRVFLWVATHFINCRVFAIEFDWMSISSRSVTADSSVIHNHFMHAHMDATLQLFIALIISCALLLFWNDQLLSLNQSSFVILLVLEMLNNGWVSV